MPDRSQHIGVEHEYTTGIAIILGDHLGTHILPSEPVDYGYYPCIGRSTHDREWNECEPGDFLVKDIPIKKVGEGLKSAGWRMLPVLCRTACILRIRQNYADDRTTDSNHQRELEDLASTILTFALRTGEGFPHPNPVNRKIR